MQDSEKEVVKYHQKKVYEKMKQNKRNNSITIITSNLPVNNTVRFETENKNGHAKSTNVRLLKLGHF